MLGLASISRTPISSLAETFVEDSIVSVVSSFTATTQENAILASGSDLSGSFTHTSEGFRVRDGDADLSAQFNQSNPSSVAIRGGASDVITLFEVTGNGSGKFSSGELNFVSDFVQESSASRLFSGSSDIISVVDLSAGSSLLFGADADMSFQFDKTVTPIFVRVGGSDVITTFEVATQGSGTFNLGDVDIVAVFTQSDAAGEILWVRISSTENVESWQNVTPTDSAVWVPIARTTR